MNLVVNAVYAMHEKGVLGISLKRTTFDKQDLAHRTDMKAGLYAELSVSDTGTGISPEVMDHIFEPFFTTKEFGQGTGMGLSVVHGIVLAHHGLIQVQSEPGQGTRFCVYFPIMEVKKVSFNTSVASLPKGTEGILFVDDEPALAAVGQRMLKSLGYKVTVTTSSRQALEIFQSRSEEFDLIITDQTMPEMSGLELIQEILKINPEFPVILCTGHSSRVSMNPARKGPFQELIMKPATIEQLALAVRKVIDRK